VVELVTVTQLLGATVGSLAFLDIARRWGGPYPPTLPGSQNGRRELVEVGLLFTITLAGSAYAIAVYRDLVQFNPLVASIGERSLSLVFFVGVVSYLVVPALVEVGLHGRAIEELGVRWPINWWPTMMLLVMGAILGAAPLLFASVRSESLFFLLLGLYTPAFEEEFLYRGVVQSKLERVVSQRDAWITSGVLFGLGHVPNDFFGPFWVTTGGDPAIAIVRLAEQTAFGLLLGLLYTKSRTLIAPVLGHYFKNDLAVILESVLP